VTIYKRDGDTFTKLSNPDVLPTGTGYGASFSSDGNYLAVAYFNSPFVTIYKRDGDTFTKLADPDVLPSLYGYGASFSPDGNYLAIAHDGSPRVTIYKPGSATVVQLPDIPPPDDKSRYLVYTGEEPAPDFDPYWDNVVILAHLNGMNGSTNFPDEKGNEQWHVGNPVISTDTYKFGGASALFHGGEDRLGWYIDSEAAIGTQDFTIELFVYRDSVTASENKTLVANRNNLPSTGGYTLSLRSDGTVALWDATSGSVIRAESTNTIIPNAWNHVMVSRKDGVFRVGVNGIVTTGVTANSSFVAGTPSLGRYPQSDSSNARPFIGYLDEFRMTVGVARYTEDYEVPDREFPRRGPPSLTPPLTN